MRMILVVVRLFLKIYTSVFNLKISIVFLVMMGFDDSYFDKIKKNHNVNIKITFKFN